MSRFAVVLMCLAAAACARGPRTTEAADVKQLMEGMIYPLSEALFDVAVWSNGEPVNPPDSDEEWEEVKSTALSLAESGNLLMTGSRARDQLGWMTRSQAFVDAARRTAEAADTRSLDNMFIAGGKLYLTCTGCHQQYSVKEVR